MTIEDTTGYELQWKADDGDWAEADTTDFTAASPDGFQTEDVLITRYHPPPLVGGTALAPGTTYTYRVRAFNDADGEGNAGQSPDDANPAAGQIEENGPWSAERSVTRTKAIAPPLAPVFEDFEAVVPPPPTISPRPRLDSRRQLHNHQVDGPYGRRRCRHHQL